MHLFALDPPQRPTPSTPLQWELRRRDRHTASWRIAMTGGAGHQTGGPWNREICCLVSLRYGLYCLQARVYRSFNFPGSIEPAGVIQGDVSMSKAQKLNRREFLGTALTATAALTILPRHVLGGAGYVAPSDKINIGCV